MYVDDPADKSTWTTFWAKIWRGEPVKLQGEDAFNYIRETTKGQLDPFQSAIEWTPKESPCYIDEMRYWVPIPFDNHSGRVTLAGDAAHPMLICECAPRSIPASSALSGSRGHMETAARGCST